MPMADRIRAMFCAGWLAHGRGAKGCRPPIRHLSSGRLIDELVKSGSMFCASGTRRGGARG